MKYETEEKTSPDCLCGRGAQCDLAGSQPVFKRTSDVSYKTGKWRRRQEGEAGSMDRGRTIFHRSDRAGTAEDRSGDCRRTAESRRWDGTIVSGRKPGSGAYYGKGKHAVRISRNRHCHSVVLKFMGVHISGRYREKRRVYQS